MQGSMTALVVGALGCLFAAIGTAVSAAHKREGFSRDLQSAADLAAASNMLFTLFGVALVGLIVLIGVRSAMNTPVVVRQENVLPPVPQSD